jgi:hypothetical protein
MRDAANPVSGQALGVIDFTDSTEGIGAEIHSCRCTGEQVTTQAA